MTRNTLWQLLLGRKGCDKMAKPTLAEKDILNPSETIKFFNLSNRKFYKFLGETDGGDFLAYYKERKLIGLLPKVVMKMELFDMQHEGHLYPS